jgi:hypothetical protein
MVRRHGEGADWRKEPVDAMVVYIYAMVVLYIYMMSCMLQRYSIFNGIIGSSEMRAQKATQLSQNSESSFVDHH